MIKVGLTCRTSPGWLYAARAILHSVAQSSDSRQTCQGPISKGAELAQDSMCRSREYEGIA
jgi:hypothetical protein